MTTEADARPEGLKNRGSLEPWIKNEVVFYQHQVEGVKWLKEQVSCLLADEMGLGKSLEALAAYAMYLWDLRKHYGPGYETSLLIVCPASAKENWHEEIGKHTRMYRTVLEGSRQERENQLARFFLMPSPKILIINYEQIKLHLDLLNSIRFGMMVVDECQALKNPDTQRARAFASLRIRRKFMMTGTPVMNHINEMWFALDQISPGQWGTYRQFINRYVQYGGQGGRSVVGIKNRTGLKTKLSQVMLRREADDCLDLPDVQFITRHARLTGEQKRLYNQCAIEDKVEIMGEITELTENDNLAKYMRLRQITNTTKGFLAEDQSHKLDLAEEDAEMILRDGHKMIAFTTFKTTQAVYAERLRRRIPDMPIYIINGDVDPKKRVQMVREWSVIPGNAVILGTIKTMGTALNMQAARHVQFLDKDVVPANNQQAIGRVKRIGAKAHLPIQVYEYLTRGTVDTRVEQLLNKKLDIVDSVLGDASDVKGFLEKLRLSEGVQDED